MNSIHPFHSIMPARGLVLAAMLLASQLASASAHAGTICIGSCSGGGEPWWSPVVESPDSFDRPLRVEDPAIVLVVPEEEDFSLVTSGRLRLIAPGGRIRAESIELSSTGRIDLRGVFELDVAGGELDLCAGACDPTGIGEPLATGLSVRLPERGGHLRFGSLESIVVVPEPGTAILAGLGLAGLALRGRRGHVGGSARDRGDRPERGATRGAPSPRPHALSPRRGVC